LIWRGLDTDVLSTAAQRLPDKIKEAKDEQELLVSGSDPRIRFAAAAKMYIERINASPDFKPKTKAYHQERLNAFFKSWPDAKANAIKDLTKAECIEWRNRFAKDYSPTSFKRMAGHMAAFHQNDGRPLLDEQQIVARKEMRGLRGAFPFLLLGWRCWLRGRSSEPLLLRRAVGRPGPNQLLLRSQGPRGPTAIDRPVTTPNQLPSPFYAHRRRFSAEGLSPSSEMAQKVTFTAPTELAVTK
jgi:hypothetical protein